MPVNGRTCYSPVVRVRWRCFEALLLANIEWLNNFLTGLSPVQRLILENIHRDGVLRSQAARSTVGSHTPPSTALSRCSAVVEFYVKTESS